MKAITQVCVSLALWSAASAGVASAATGAVQDGPSHPAPSVQPSVWQSRLDLPAATPSVVEFEPVAPSAMPAITPLIPTHALPVAASSDAPPESTPIAIPNPSALFLGGIGLLALAIKRSWPRLIRN